MPSALWETWLLAAWLTGCLTYPAIVWIGVGRLDSAHTRLHAEKHDPGTGALYAVVVAASFAGLIGALGPHRAGAGGAGHHLAPDPGSVRAALRAPPLCNSSVMRGMKKADSRRFGMELSP